MPIGVDIRLNTAMLHHYSIGRVQGEATPGSRNLYEVTHLFAREAPVNRRSPTVAHVYGQPVEDLVATAMRAVAGEPFDPRQMLEEQMLEFLNEGHDDTFIPALDAGQIQPLVDRLIGLGWRPTSH